jgi:hypothetical protein
MTTRRSEHENPYQQGEASMNKAQMIAAAEAEGLTNVGQMWEAAVESGVPFPVACALFEKESGGANVYGHDVGGALSTRDRAVEVCGRTYPEDSTIPVSAANAGVFLLKIGAGARSNGMGPAQITWAGDLADGRSGGFFRDMLDNRGLIPWHVLDNMVYGLGLLHLYKAGRGTTWEDAGTRYNGHREYGEDLAEKIREWRARFDD